MPLQNAPAAHTASAVPIERLQASCYYHACFTTVYHHLLAFRLWILA